MQDTFDIIIIWAGSAGLTLVAGFTALGKRVVLIERERIGGDCTNSGCVPSKALLFSGKEWSDYQKSYSYMTQRRELIRSHEEPRDIKKLGATFFAGEARMISGREVEVAGRRLHAERIYIATGSTPKRVPIPGVAESDIITHREVFDLEAPLKHLIIIWGSFIAYELAQAFAQIGTHVTIVYRGEKLLGRLDAEVFPLVESRLQDLRIDVIYGASEYHGSDGKVLVVGEKSVPYDNILLAIGRSFDPSSLDLASAGIVSDEKGIVTGSYGQTNIPWVYALWDCASGFPQFTHAANDAARTMIRNSVFPLWKKKIQTQNIPSVVYGTPEIAHIGLTEDEARDIYGDALYVWLEKTNDRMTIESASGFAKIIALPLTGRIVGATIVSPRAGELIGTISLLMSKRLSVFTLSATIFPYPTESDILKRAASKVTLSLLRNFAKDIFSLLRRNLAKIFAFFLWMSLIWAFFSYKKMTWLSDLAIAKLIYQFLSTNMYGPILYICIYAVRPIVLFPATLMTLLSGVLFGPVWGFAYTMIGENMSANIAYSIGRFFWKEKPGKTIALKKEDHVFSAFITILITRFAFFPFDIVNYSSWLFRVNWLGFALATLVGIIPGALVFILIGASIQDFGTFDPTMIHLDSTLLISSWILFVITLIIASFVKKYAKKL